MTKLFVVCIKTIIHHDCKAFHKGHVYVSDKRKETYHLTSDIDDVPEAFPKNYFRQHFRVIFPVMEEELK